MNVARFDLVSPAAATDALQLVAVSNLPIVFLNFKKYNIL